MGKNRAVVCVSGFTMSAVSILAAEGTAKKTLVTAPAEGAIIKSINITSNDTATKVCMLWITDGSANDFQIGAIPVAIESGTKADGSVASVNGLDSAKIKGLEKDIQGNYILKLNPNWTLKASAAAALTTDKKFDIVTSWESITA